MKNKVLPLSLVTLVVFLGAFLISSTVTFQESFLSDPDNDVTHEASIASQHYLAKLQSNYLNNYTAPENEVATKSTMEDFDWHFLGPDNVGGFTSAILYDNQDTSTTTIIAGAFTGGLYKSTNSGLTWNKINGLENSLRVSCIDQADDGTIYVGTGVLYPGSGIYKSTDGETFTLLPATDPTTGNTAFAEVYDIKINHTTGTLFASTLTGVFYSDDEGGSWNLARSSDDMPLEGYSSDMNVGSNGITATSLDGLCYISPDGNPNNFVLHSSDTFDLPYENVAELELAIAPSNPDVLYAIVLDVNGSLINIYTSADAGVNWRVVAPGGSTILPLDFTALNIALAVFPEDETRILVGGTDMWEGRKYDETGFYQWTQRSDGALPPQIFPSYIHPSHYNYVFRPGKNNELLAGHNGGVSRGILNSEFFEFQELSKTYTTAQAMTLGTSGIEKFVVSGFDQAGVQLIEGHTNPATAKNGIQILANIPPYGGNGGESFLSIMDAEVVIYSDNGGNFSRSEDLGFSTSNSFLSTEISLPSDIVPALFWENFDNQNSRDSINYPVRAPLAAGTEVYVNSHNRGFPFKWVADIDYQVGDTVRVKDIVATKFFLGAESEVWMTLDILDFSMEPEWFQISEESREGIEGVVSCMALSNDANYLYVGTEEGRVYRIANLAMAYDYDRADVRSPYCIVSTAEIPLIDPVTQAQNTNTITAITVDPQDPDQVVIGLGNYGLEHYAFRSANATAANPSFASIQSNLPKVPIYSAMIEMNNSNLCMLGTDYGVYSTQSLNAGTPEWEGSQGIIGATPVFVLKQQTVRQPDVSYLIWNGEDSVMVTYPGTDNFGVIYAAANGRGLFMSNKYEQPVGISSPEMPQLQSSVYIFPNPANDHATVEYELSQAGNVDISVFDINGKLIVQEQFSKEGGTHQYQLNCSNIPRGMYVVSVRSGNTVKTSKFIVAH